MYGNGGDNSIEYGHNYGSSHLGSGDGPGKDDDRKLFIGGLSWETTEKDLRDYFSKFGSIDNLTLKTDPATGKSRGFAFVVYSDPSSLESVMMAPEHLINGKKIDPKKAKARTGKVFVGGLSQEITNEEIRNYFSQFGTVLELETPIDKLKNQRKGYCFVIFDNESVVNEVLKNPKQIIGGKEVDVKKAQPSQNSKGGVGGGGMMGWSSMGVSTRGGRGGGTPRGMMSSNRGGSSGFSSRGGRGDYYSGGYATSNSYGASAGGYYDYFGGGYNTGSGYGGGGYDYSGYSGYEGYGYESSSGGGGPYDTSNSLRGGGSVRGRGTSTGSMSGKQRGGSTRGIQRHVPY